ncbi:MAG: hypothetical protein KDD63_21170 [Bacteroidetes bacterium]|nr:hypothetical protein [Bacteroidota bacterium]
MKAFNLGPLKWLANGFPVVPSFTLIILIFVSPQLRADYQTGNIPYGITIPGGNFNEGDTIPVSIWAGSSSQSLENVSGFDLAFTLTEYVVFPSHVSLDFSKSWISQEMNYTVGLDSEHMAISFLAIDSTLSMEGYGEIARFKLICAVNNVSGSQLLEGSGGGVIIQIDDLGLRRSNPVKDHTNSFHVIYPNPTSGKVFWKGDVSTISHWILRDLYGKELARGVQFPIDIRSYLLPQGQYYLDLNFSSGTRNGFFFLFQ